MKTYFESLARYNRWANRRVYAALAELSTDDIAAPRTGFFPSLLKTLNHLIVTDRIWLSRLTATPDTEAKALDQIIAADLADLTAQRRALDERIIGFVHDLSPTRLGEILVYKTMAGVPHETPINMVLAHVFNHQTHHRGQAHGMLSGTKVPPPSLDMIVFLREERA